MKRLIVIALMFFLIGINAAYAAESLQVQKIVENKDIKVGDDVRILLKFTNPFGQEIPVKIVDKNILGNNGMDIQCLEHTISSDKETAFSYEPIKPYASGEYTLNSAEVTYTNPQTGIEETVKSNALKVSVKDSNVKQGQAQGITTIYRCNGVNVQTTSYSSSGRSFNIQIGGSNIYQQPNQMPNQQQGSPESRIQNNQLNQNTNALRQQMEQQLKQQKQMEQEFQQNLAANQEFQKQHEKLTSSGYNLTDASFNLLTNDTGSFELTYQKPNGEMATMKGEMENGTMKDIMLLTDEDKQKILDLLKQNKKFQQYNRQLLNQGFNRTEPVFNQISQNHTKITVPYENKGMVREVTADYINGTIQNVSLENNVEEGETNLWWLLLLILIIGTFAWAGYTRYINKSKNQSKGILPDVEVENPLDYTKKARNMLEEAKSLFDNGKEKDAYEKVSRAIRFYFSYKLNIKKEITNTELITVLKKEKIKQRSEVKKCLDRCSLVEFAKYKPNKKDFNEIIKIGNKIIA